MSHLKKYPTTADVRALVTDEWLDNEIMNVPSYNVTESLVSYAGNVTPDLLMAFAQFSHTLLAIYPDAEIGRDFSVSRKKSREELEELVLSNEATRRYYHPDEYPEYTDEDIAGL